MDQLQKELVVLELINLLDGVTTINELYEKSVEITLKSIIIRLEEKDKGAEARVLYDSFTSLFGEDALELVLFSLNRDGIVRREYYNIVNNNLKELINIRINTNNRIDMANLILDGQVYSSTELYSSLRTNLSERISELTGVTISAARVIRPNFKKREYSITWNANKDPQEVIDMIIEYGLAVNRTDAAELHLLRNYYNMIGSNTLDVVIPELGIILKPCARTIERLANYGH